MGVDFTTIRYFCSSMNEDFLSKCFQIVLLIELAKSETHTHTHTHSLSSAGVVSVVGTDGPWLSGIHRRISA